MNLIEWTYSKLDDYNYCILRGYLRWIEGVKTLTTPQFVKGFLFHKSIENFWKNLGDNPQEVLKTKNKKDGKKYSNAREFADYLSGKWTSLIIGSEHVNRKIIWDYPEQPYHMKRSILEIGFYLFPYLIERGEPLYSEISFKFILGHRKFKGKIDEIRKKDGKIVVTDFKTGRPWMGDVKLNHDIQMTMYNVGICSLCYGDEKFAESLGIMDERKNFMGHPNFVKEDIEHEFVMLEAPYLRTKFLEEKKSNLPEFSLKTSRKESHFQEVLKMLDGIEESIKSGIIYPQTGRKCDYCVMKTECKRRLENLVQNAPLEKNGQAVMEFAFPLFKKPVNKEDLKIHQLNLFEQITDKINLRRRVKNAKKKQEKESLMKIS